jgi:nucleoside-diphosphate-sugar epimerase
MRILITGGAGFIGSHLTEAYLKNGDDVYVIDDLSTGSAYNLKWLKDNPVYKKRLFITIDTILNRDILLKLVETCDTVFHLAAAVGVGYVLDNPIDSIKTNIHGTDNVLEACAKLNKRVLIASSSEVYGKHTHAPLIETDNIIYGSSAKFRWSYASSKLMGEFMSLAYFRSLGLRVTVVRPFNTVGPRQTGNYGMVVPRLVRQAMEGRPLTVYGDGKQTRTFSYVKDVVWALMHLVEKENTHGQVFNIGGTEEISIFDLAKRVIAVSKTSSSIKLIPYDVAFGEDYEDMQRRVPGIDKIRTCIGFDPQTPLDTMLQTVISSMDNH